MPTDPARTEADRRFLALRASGFTGPIDQDGYPETDPTMLAIFASLDEATTRPLGDFTAAAHLMIPNAFPPSGLRGTAAYACDRDGTRGVHAPMRQRTLDPTKVTCPACTAAAGRTAGGARG